MRVFALGLLALAGCASNRGNVSETRISTTTTRETEGASSVWVFTLTNHNPKTLKIASLEFSVGDGAFEPVGGMAEIAHACREGTTTISPDESIHIVRPVADRPVKMKLVYILDGSATRWDHVVTSP